MAPRVHSARTVPEVQLVLEEAVRGALETTSKTSNEDICARSSNSIERKRGGPTTKVMTMTPLHDAAVAAFFRALAARDDAEATVLGRAAASTITPISETTPAAGST